MVKLTDRLNKSGKRKADINYDVNMNKKIEK